MEIKTNKYVVYSVIIILVALMAFNFEKLTGYNVKTSNKPYITINNLKGSGVLYNRDVARLRIENSFPNQRIKAYALSNGRAIGYNTKSEDCKPLSASSLYYTCNADIYISSRELMNGKRYYFQALDKKGVLTGNKAEFLFNSGARPI